MLLGSASCLCESTGLLLGRAGTAEVETGVDGVDVGEAEAMGAMTGAIGEGRVILGKRDLFDSCANGGAKLSCGQGTVEEIEGACALFTSWEFVFSETLSAFNFWIGFTLEEDVVSTATDPILPLVEGIMIGA